MRRINPIEVKFSVTFLSTRHCAFESRKGGVFLVTPECMSTLKKSLLRSGSG
jgi:hypothetical protein